MDCANPALFETVPGIDDLQAFEELKEAWYNWATTSSKLIQNDVQGIDILHDLLEDVFACVFMDFSMKSYAVRAVLGRGDH